MPAIEAEAIHVMNPAADAERLVSAIPVGQGLCLESPLGEQLLLWRYAEDTFELHFRSNEIRGSPALAIAAAARFMSHEAMRANALDTIRAAIGRALGAEPARPAANDSKLKN